MRPDPGSFRDPSNSVYLSGGRIVRLLDDSAAADYERVAQSTFFGDATAAGRLIATRRVDVPDGAPAGAVAALEHDRVPVISYAFEWPHSMLRDAALLHLELVSAALENGIATKDGTPYNVQFLGARPVFIDIGSFEPATPGEPWFGYRQFCQMFLFPLALSSLRGIPHHAALRGAIEGITPEVCAASLRRRDRLRPTLFAHVTLQARSDRKALRRDPGDLRGELKAAGFGTKIVLAQLARLRAAVEKLSIRTEASVWSGYSDRGHYDEESLAEKSAFVTAVAAELRPDEVLDLGCNDGYFSDLVLPHTERVVAVDGDALVIDRLYQRLRERNDERILPLVVDLADPPGGLGWRNRERPAFTDRVSPGLVLCLALVHHLAISANVPLEEVVAFLAGFGAEVVLEFPTPDDPMVRRLMSAKKDRRLDRYTTATLESALARHYDTVRRDVLESGTRILYHLRPRRDERRHDAGEGELVVQP